MDEKNPGPEDQARGLLLKLVRQKKYMVILSRPKMCQIFAAAPPSSTRLVVESPFEWCKHLCGLIKRPKFPNSIFVLTKRNYEVQVNFGQIRDNLHTLVSILDNSAAASFIRRDALSPGIQKHTTFDGILPPVRDARKRLIPFVGKINLTMEPGMRLELVSFIVAKKLAAPRL